MPTKEQIARAQELRPKIAERFREIGKVKPIAVEFRVSQYFVIKTLGEFGIETTLRRGARGPDNPVFRGDTATKHAGRARARVRYSLGTCTECGATATDRHHRDGNTLNNEPANVALVCRRCHMLLDGRLEKFRTLPRKGKRSQGTTCKVCGQQWYPLRKGRCSKCALYFYAHGTERPAQRRAITHCPRGHEYTKENTRLDKKGCKNCRACRAEDERIRRRLARAILAGEIEFDRDLEQ